MSLLNTCLRSPITPQGVAAIDSSSDASKREHETGPGEESRGRDDAHKVDNNQQASDQHQEGTQYSNHESCIQASMRPFQGRVYIGNNEVTTPPIEVQPGRPTMINTQRTKSTTILPLSKNNCTTYHLGITSQGQ